MRSCATKYIIPFYKTPTSLSPIVLSTDLLLSAHLPSLYILSTKFTVELATKNRRSTLNTPTNLKFYVIDAFLKRAYAIRP